MPWFRSTATARFACDRGTPMRNGEGPMAGSEAAAVRDARSADRRVAASTLERAVAGSGPSSAFHRRRHVPSVQPRKFGSIENEIRRP